MTYYDDICIGSSISSLLYATTIKNKKILIIEKDNYIGGAWRVNSDNYKSIDLVGHLIVPTNDIIGKKIIEYFKKLNIELEVIKKKDFIFETDNYRSNGKQGKPIICRNGWVSFNNRLINYVNTFDNIKIIKNGGWHFSNIKTPEEIEVKYKSYLHHFEYEKSLLKLDEIKKFIKNKRAIYDLTADKYEEKMGNGAYLKRFDQSLLPKFIQDNKKKFVKWFDQN